MRLRTVALAIGLMATVPAMTVPADARGFAAWHGGGGWGGWRGGWGWGGLGLGLAAGAVVGTALATTPWYGYGSGWGYPYYGYGYGYPAYAYGYGYPAYGGYGYGARFAYRPFVGHRVFASRPFVGRRVYASVHGVRRSWR